MNVENILYSIYNSGRWLTQGSVYIRPQNMWMQSSMFCMWMPGSHQCFVWFSLNWDQKGDQSPFLWTLLSPLLTCPMPTWANWKVILYVNIPCWHCKQSIWKIQRICQSVRDAHREIIMSKITLCFLNSRPHLHGFVWPIMATQNINIAGSKR